MFAHMLRLIIDNRFHLLLKYFSIRNWWSDVPSAPIFVDAVSIFVACAVEFEVDVIAPEDFSVSNRPLRGLTIRSSCVCCSFAWEMAWDSPIVNIALQTMKRQLFVNTLIMLAFSRMLPRNKNAPWRQTIVWRHGGHLRIYTSKDESCEFAAR